MKRTNFKSGKNRKASALRKEVSNHHQRQTLLVVPMRLPLDEELLANLTGALFKVAASLGRSSPVTAMVVRRAPLTTGAVRGLRTLVFQSLLCSPLTIRRAAPAEKRVFSFGGLHAEAAVGLLRR